MKLLVHEGHTILGSKDSKIPTEQLNFPAGGQAPVLQHKVWN